jgi:hypothetical protein
MKKLLGTDLSGSYTFNAAAKTITFSGISESITLSNILLITNTTANTIIYNFADPLTGAVSFNNNILTLDFDTTSMNSSDVLQIYLDTPSNEESLHDLLRRMNKLLEASATSDLYQRQRVVLDAIGNTRGTPTEVGTTVPVSGTVTSSTPSTTTLSTGASDIQYVQSSQVSPYAVTSNVTFWRVMSGIVDERWRIIEEARTAYGTAIRRNLVFS